MKTIYNYFDQIKSLNLNQKSELTPAYYIKQRKNRALIKGSNKYKIFVVGDIIEFLFVFKSIPLLYSGICMAIKKKAFITPDVTLVLRNIIMKVAVEVTV